MRWTLARLFVIGLGFAAIWSSAPLRAQVTVTYIANQGFLLESEGKKVLAVPTSRSGESEKPAAGKFLVAKREMLDPNFARTVVLLLNYDENGAVGLVINRRSDIRATDLLPQIDGLKERTDQVFVGGPVTNPPVFLLVKSSKPLPDSTLVLDGVFVSQSEELLENLTDRGNEDNLFRIYAGYSGWAPGQLDHELSRGDWYVFPGDGDLVFAENTEDVWKLLVPPVPTQQVRYGDISPSYARFRGAPWLKSRSVSSPTISARSASPR